MFTILRQCAEHILQPLWFKVNVTSTGQRSYYMEIQRALIMWEIIQRSTRIFWKFAHLLLLVKLPITFPWIQVSGCWEIARTYAERSDRQTKRGLYNYMIHRKKIIKTTTAWRFSLPSLKHSIQITLQQVHLCVCVFLLNIFLTKLQ